MAFQIMVNGKSIRPTLVSTRRCYTCCATISAAVQSSVAGSDNVGHAPPSWVASSLRHARLPCATSEGPCHHARRIGRGQAPFAEGIHRQAAQCGYCSSGISWRQRRCWIAIEIPPEDIKNALADQLCGAERTIGLSAFSERQRRSRDDSQRPFAQTLYAVARRRHRDIRMAVPVRFGQAPGNLPFGLRNNRRWRWIRLDGRHGGLHQEGRARPGISPLWLRSRRKSSMSSFRRSCDLRGHRADPTASRTGASRLSKAGALSVPRVRKRVASCSQRRRGSSESA